ncbi:MAG: hypothetical protein WA771_05560 [Chthoniobacterales bacterium]
MITFLVVGRNDNYGVNLQKRTALSLNFFGSFCREPGDEIVYVDCNSPEADVTLVEAIADTLTEKTRARLRSFRISGEVMREAIGETPLPFSDELARNVGIRRSNPDNLWLLSTNCDVMIYCYKPGGLHTILRDLPSGYYACPRVNIPASQWQQLDRTDVSASSEFAEAAILRGMRPPPEKQEEWLRFSAVGDFQLAPRKQWIEIGGCEEMMKLWGHSDANNSRRLNLLNGGGRTPDLGSGCLVMHFDHHLPVSSGNPPPPQNDWREWVENVTSPLSRNAKNWGLNDRILDIIDIDFEKRSTSEIFAHAPRPRRLWQTLRTRIIAKFWSGIGQTVNRIEQLTSKH